MAGGARPEEVGALLPAGKPSQARRFLRPFPQGQKDLDLRLAQGPPGNPRGGRKSPDAI